MPLLLTSLLPPFLLGLTLLTLGLRGPRRDNHPHCRRCDFDLSARAQGSPRCPECGTDLSSPRATRPARRHKRPLPLLTGLLLILLPIAATAALTIGTLRGVTWDQHKPVWLLLHESTPAAATELFRRHSAGLLTDSQTRALVSHVLNLQADLSRPWHPLWGRLLTDARSAGKVTPEQWQRYVRQAIHFELIARPQVARGNVLPAELYNHGRAWTGFSPLYLSTRTLSLTLDGAPLEGESNHFGGAGTLDESRDTCDSYWPRLTNPRFTDLPDGPHTLKLELEWRVREWDAANRKISDTPIATGRSTLTTTVTLVPHNPDITLVTDESLRPAVERSVTLGPKTPTPTAPAAIVISDDESPRARLYLEIKNPPVGLAFTVTLRDPAGREFPFVENWVWGTGYAASPNKNDTPLISGHLDAFTADRVDVLLRPSPERALKTPDLTQIWGHEITLKNVPVQWAPNSVRPTKLPDYLRPKPPTTRRSRATRPTTVQANVK